MERAAEVREEVVAYSSRVQRELEEARAAMLQAEKRYQELEAESKETTEKLAETIREVLQQVEGLAR